MSFADFVLKIGSVSLLCAVNSLHNEHTLECIGGSTPYGNRI
jgi:hypothetical protein